MVYIWLLRLSSPGESFTRDQVKAARHMSSIEQMRDAEFLEALIHAKLLCARATNE
jgi:hypothetical protein